MGVQMHRYLNPPKELPTLQSLSEREEALICISLGNPGLVTEYFYYEILESGHRVCYSKFRGLDYIDDWSEEFTCAFNPELFEKERK